MWKRHKLKIIIGAGLILLVAAMAILTLLPGDDRQDTEVQLQKENTQEAPSGVPEEPSASPDASEPSQTTETEPSEQANPAAPTAVDTPSQPTAEAVDPTQPTADESPSQPTQQTEEQVQPTQPAPKTCTVSISCSNAVNSSSLPASVRSILPADGWILGQTTVTLQEGDTAFSVLQRVAAEYGIQMESSWTPLYNSAYVEGIGNLYEFDCGELSGWMYCVNGQFASYGSSSYTLQDGDVLRWAYTCDLGADLNGTVG